MLILKRAEITINHHENRTTGERCAIQLLIQIVGACSLENPKSVAEECCGSSTEQTPTRSDDINSWIAQRSLVVLFPWWLLVLSACWRIYPNFPRSQPRANYHMQIIKSHSRHHDRYTCWKRLGKGQEKLPLMDLPPSPTKTRVDAPKIAFLMKSRMGSQM